MPVASGAYREAPPSKHREARHHPPAGLVTLKRPPLMFTVPCPCCHGKRVLLVYDADAPDGPPTRHDCWHCQATGSVQAEVSHFHPKGQNDENRQDNPQAA